MRAVAFILAPKNSGLKRYRQKAFSILQNADRGKIIELRGEDIPFMVEEYAKTGKKVIGLTGEDLLNEYCAAKKSNNLEILEKVEWKESGALFGKPALCLLGPKNKELGELPKELVVCIAGKYRNVADAYLAELEKSGFTFRKIYVSGCVETGYSEGIADLAVDIVYSGSTMEKNGLKVYEKIEESDFVIIAPKSGIGPKESVREISKYSPPTEGRRGMLRLDFNENTTGCSPKVVQALRKITAEEISAYPEYGKFTAKLAESLNIDENEILLTNGSDEAIKLAMDVFIEKGDEVVIPEPTFRLFEIYAQIAGAKIAKMNYNEDMSFPTDKILKKLDEKPKMLVLVNPNNPTGTGINGEDLLKIIVRAKNTIILLDEAYCEYSGKSAKEKIGQFPNLIILRTFSKAFGLAGLRIGYLISNPKIISAMKKAASPYSINAIAIKAAEAAIEDEMFVEKYVNEIRVNREIVRKELGALNIDTFPSETNFIIAKFGKSSGTICKRLRAKGILVRDVGKYGLLEGCLRITIGTMEQCKTFLEGLKAVLNEDAMIFDMDGVLVDVSGSYRLAVQKTVEFFTKRPLEFSEIQEFKETGGCNNDWDVAQAIIIERKMAIPRERIIEKFQEIYENENLSANEKLLAKKQTLSMLQEKFKLGIFTGRPRKEAISTLEKFGIAEFFDAIITNDDVPEGKGKPDPLGIELAMEQLGAKKAYYFGDAVDDIEAAIRAKISPVGIIPPTVNSAKLSKLLREKGAIKVGSDVNKAAELII